MGSIQFQNLSIDFSLPNKIDRRKWLKECVNKSDFIVGNLNIIFCSDDYLLELNQKCLTHDYYTDIITFDYCVGNIISGDLFISLDRVAENAFSRDILFLHELDRVLIHGILHLMGFMDKTDLEASSMREAENVALENRMFHVEQFNYVPRGTQSKNNA